MARWTPAMNAAIEGMTSHEDWPKFHESFPEVSYDAWENKRRRVQKHANDPEPSLIFVPAGGSYVGPSITYYSYGRNWSWKIDVDAKYLC